MRNAFSEENINQYFDRGNFLDLYEAATIRRL
jgi:hypothetical protein